MKGLQRKCLIGSAFLHGLLLVLVLVGSAFVSRKPPEPTPAFDVFDAKAILVDEPNVVTGGNPTTTTPPAPAPPVTPSPQQERPAVQEPKPPKVAEPQPEQPKVPEVRPEASKAQPKNRTDPDAFNFDKTITKAPPQQKPDKPTFDFSKTERKKIQPAKEAKDSEGEENARGTKDNRATAARASAVANAMKNLEGELSATGTSIDIPGPGGVAYASYGLYLKKLYETAWIPPMAGRGNEPIVEVEVVISKDGTVISSRITKPSGRRELDATISNALKRVRKARPLPEGTKDEKRLFKLEFNLTEKLSVG